MSERGSFVTSYIFCGDCLRAAEKVLLDREKYLCSTKIPSWEENNSHLPIIAGKVGASFPGGEFLEFEIKYIPSLKKLICHNMEIAVLSAEGECEVYKLTPEAPC